MIRDRTIICIASDWESDPTSKHHVMSLLARHNRLLWVNYRGSRSPSLSASDFKSAIQTVGRVVRGAKRISPSMVQVTPLVMPGVREDWLGRLSRRATVAQIRHVLRRFGSTPERVQIWTFAPDVAFLAGCFGEERFVYYCVDEYAQFQGFDLDAMLQSERRMLQCADVVITSSKALYEAKSAVHPNTHLVRHGVDVEHFAQALNPHVQRPEELHGLSGPIVGFFGLIHHWIDTHLLVEVSCALPDVHFVLLGQAFGKLRHLRRRANVHLLGRKPYAHLPAYCAAFDVGILPFQCNDFTRFVNPIKLREYLAAGLPVVSTPLPEAEVFVPDVTIARSPRAFAAACRSAIEHSSIEERVRRSSAVADETWNQVVQRLSAIVMDTSKPCQRPDGGRVELPDQQTDLYQVNSRPAAPANPSSCEPELLIHWSPLHRRWRPCRAGRPAL